MSDIKLPEPPEGFFWRIKPSIVGGVVVQLRKKLWCGLSYKFDSVITENSRISTVTRQMLYLYYEQKWTFEISGDYYR